jgi:hypothetical protein
VQHTWVLTTDNNQTFGLRLTQALQQQADESFDCSLLDSLQD